MKEKYESLSLATLKDLAKARGLKGISTMRKPELIERMLEEDRKEQTAENEQTISGTAEENTIPARPEPVAAAIIMAEMKMQDVRTVIMEKTDRRTL